MERKRMSGWSRVTERSGLVLWKNMNERNRYCVTDKSEGVPTKRGVTRQNAVTQFNIRVSKRENDKPTNITELAEFFPDR